MDQDIKDKFDCLENKIDCLETKFSKQEKIMEEVYSALTGNDLGAVGLVTRVEKQEKEIESLNKWKWGIGGTGLLTILGGLISYFLPK